MSSSDIGAVIGLAVDVAVLAALNYWIRRLNRSADEIKKAPFLKLDSDLIQTVRDTEQGYVAYACIEGEVIPTRNALFSHYMEGQTGVIKEGNITEHKSKRVQGVWADVKNTIQDKIESVPFVLRSWMGKGRDGEIHVTEPTEAHFLMDDLTITHDHFEPRNSSLVSRGIDHIFGEVTKGVHETERMLLTNTVLLGIGEIALVDGKLQLRPPQSGARYILTKLTRAEVIKRLEKRSFWVKMFSVLTGLTGLAILGYLVRKHYKVWRENRQRENFLAQMREMRTRSSNDDSASDATCCVICLSNPREIVLLNCGHLCLCAECLAVLPEPLKCPVCRQDVERYVTTYNP